MLKQSIVAGLLCLSGQAFANITVTTTEDVVKDDDQCSLREAITYANEYLTAKADETESEKATREAIKNAGYNGCGDENATASILLTAKETYTLNAEVKITSALTIQTESTVFNAEATAIGLENATIKAAGQHRLFNVNDGDADISQITVKFTQVNLQGCGSDTICAAQGGIIFNRENLTLEHVKLFDGFANEGGAIYSDGIITGTNGNSASFVNITNSLVQNNKAQQGAVLYIGQPLFYLKNSVFRNNTSTASGASMIYSATKFNDETTNSGTFTRVSYLSNSTLFKNTGFLLNVRDGVYVNNVTAVDNAKGFYLDAPNEKAHIANSIVVNQSTDCSYSSSDKSFSMNNLVGSSCKSGEDGNRNIFISSLSHNKLFAGDSSEGSCDRPPADGLLCPYSTPNEYFLGYFKPRLLSAYSVLTDSPIVNRGRLFSDGTDLGVFSCEGQDQRGFTRASSVHCDIGAIELVISPEVIYRVGQDINYGDVAEMSIVDSLADGELLPAEECAAILGADTAPDGTPWQVGCLRVEQSSATPESKGTLTLDADGKLIYRPNSNYHGLDEFNLRVITTGSRFSDAETDRDIVVPVRIVQSPEDNFESKKVKVSGGGIGYSIFALLMIALGRTALRKKKA
ncbi:Acinetobacter rhombotarget A [Acinetobacter marinus]|uniref:Acinetobacter rhombotarget A n=1 Tax=Acinetobacter marinus TaxID=281375 RepID=A0A1G6KS16_9GAMM|nr:rhombotarget A [Acinetobacter marinus]SDC33869.1 Acinetobacter rhombotarget A [Acinetobacter marinus]